MAANIHGCCVKCNKTGGILLCNGCQQIFCFKHVNEHRDQIEQQLEYLINEENLFENYINQKNDSHNLFNDIDKWKKDMIEQIKQIAKQAKEDLRQLINQSNELLLNDCKNIKENLLLLKESDDLSETQLNKLSNQLNNLKKEINLFQLIKSTNSIYLKIEKHKNYEINDINDKLQSSLPLSPSSSEKNLINIEIDHSKKQGSILIREIDPYGHFIIIEHNGLTTDKEQDMVGWTIRRSIDSYNEIIYRFPNEFSLKPKSFVKILSKNASKTRYSYEKDGVLIAESIATWGIGTKKIFNCLLNANGDEVDILTQTF